MYSKTISLYETPIMITFQDLDAVAPATPVVIPVTMLNDPAFATRPVSKYTEKVFNIKFVLSARKN